jgi:hypothetical protein
LREFALVYKDKEGSKALLQESISVLKGLILQRQDDFGLYEGWHKSIELLSVLKNVKEELKEYESSIESKIASYRTLNGNIIMTLQVGNTYGLELDNPEVFIERYLSFTFIRLHTSFLSLSKWQMVQ